MSRVVHVIQRMSRGGASRALAALATHVHEVEHSVLDLTVTRSRDERCAVLERADIVHVHFWNTPELYELLASELPAMRLLLWAAVAGDSPPHVLTPKLCELTDVAVAASPYTPGLPVIPPVVGWAHLGGLETRSHDGFNVGYVGTVDFVKMHPGYVRMSARVAIPEATFIVCGSGDGFRALAREADELGARERFELRGFADDVGAVLAELDSFGYPLCPGNYSATDIALQEAMYARVPPVVMAYGGAQRMVDHRRSGLVARSEDEYVEAIEWLHAHPRERRELGEQAHAKAVHAWSVDSASEAWESLYKQLLSQPKRRRAWRSDPELARAALHAPGAALFVESLGHHGEPFRISLLARDRERAAEAERAIAASGVALRSADSGGVLHYRGLYPDDPYLRLWSGLLLRAQGRRALAAGEFAGAMKQGLDRAEPYLAEIHG